MCTLAHEILKLCDEVRDDVLPNLGVRLEDQDGMPVAIAVTIKEHSLLLMQHFQFVMCKANVC